MSSEKENLKKHLLVILKNKINIDEIDNIGIWDLEEKMKANHFETHKSPGIRGGHIPLKIINVDEIIELNKSII